MNIYTNNEFQTNDWIVCDYETIFDNKKYNYFDVKNEFKYITNFLKDRLGQPRSICILGGFVVGATNWESIDLNDQYQALQAGAGVFDASAMSYLHIKGPDACNILNMLTPRSINQFAIGSANFVIFTTTQGTVDDESIVLKISDNEFLLSCGGCKLISHMHEAIRTFPNAIVKKSSLISFNIKGPKRFLAAELLLSTDPNTNISIRNTPTSSFKKVKFRNEKEGFIVKTKIGIEIWSDLSSILELWDFMLNQRNIFTPCGWDVLNIYRMECKEIKFMLYPLDINARTSLHSIGCSWMISDKKYDYIGRSILEKKLIKPSSKLYKLKCISQTQVDSKIEYNTKINIYSDKNDFVGYITSGAFSPKYKTDIVYAYIFDKHISSTEFF